MYEVFLYNRNKDIKFTTTKLLKLDACFVYEYLALEGAAFMYQLLFLLIFKFLNFFQKIDFGEVCFCMNIHTLFICMLIKSLFLIVTALPHRTCFFCSSAGFYSLSLYHIALTIYCMTYMFLNTM